MKNSNHTKLSYLIRFPSILILLIIWSSSAVSQTISEGGRLINSSWNLFTGKDGRIDEDEAFRQAKKGIEIAKRDGPESTRSIGANNLGVIYSCAYDKKIRNTKLGIKIINDEFGKNKFSTDNYIWNVFTRKLSVNEAEYFSMLKVNHSNHVIWKYISLNSNNLPKNQQEVFKILEDTAKNGDWVAAKRLALMYECDFESLDLKNAIKWMKISHQHAVKYSNDDKEIASIQNRLNRYYILDRNKPNKKTPVEMYSR